MCGFFIPQRVESRWLQGLLEAKCYESCQALCSISKRSSFTQAGVCLPVTLLHTNAAWEVLKAVVDESSPSHWIYCCLDPCYWNRNNSSLSPGQKTCSESSLLHPNAWQERWEAGAWQTEQNRLCRFSGDCSSSSLNKTLPCLLQCVLVTGLALVWFQMDESGAVDKNTYYNLCNVSFTSPVNALSHCFGKMHSKMEKQFSGAELHMPEQSTQPVSGKN